MIVNYIFRALLNMIMNSNCKIDYEMQIMSLVLDPIISWSAKQKADNLSRKFWRLCALWRI